MELTEFVSARLDEDEAVALEATRGPWVFDGNSGAIYTPEIRTSSEVRFREDAVYGDDGVDERNAAHITRHNPARALAQVEAMRRIVALHTPERGPRNPVTDFGVRTCPLCGPSHPWNASPPFGPDEHLRECDTLRALASVYADHPDFDPAWA